MHKVAVFGIALIYASVALGEPEANRPSTSTIIRQAPSPLDAALNVYAELTGKTILRVSLLPPLQDFIADPLPADTNAAVALIESDLRRHGIDMVPDGEFFVRVMPAGWSNSPMAGFLATLKPSLPDLEGVPIGTIHFSPASPDQVLKVFADLRSRTLIQSKYLGAPLLMLKTQRSMTRTQAGYAITVLLAINGVAALDDGKKFVQLVPVQDWSKIQMSSPSPQTGAELLDPKDIPKFNGERPANPLNRLNQVYQRFFHGSPPWTPKPVDQLVEFYAELTDQKAASSKNYGRQLVRFEVTTALTKEEVLYAIETTLKLEGLAIAKVNGEKISVIPLAEKRRSEREKTPNTSR